MKVTIEKVERLVERADVGYEEAKAALEAADGNLLDAIISLERDGKLGPNAGRHRPVAYATETGVAMSAVGETYGAGLVPQTSANPNFTIVGNNAADAGNAGKAGKAGKAAKAGKSVKAGKTGKPEDADNKGAGGDGQPGAGGQPGGGAYHQAYSGPYGQPGGPYSGQYGDQYGQNYGGQYGQYYGGQYGQNYGGQYGQNYNGQYGQYYSGQYGQNYGGQYGRPGGGYNQPGSQYKYKDETTGFEDNIRRFFKWLGRVFRAGFTNYFEVWRKGERILFFPVILFLFCLIPWVFWITIGVLIIGLFCGCKYSFSGPNLGKKKVNDAMNRASEMAEEIKNEEDPHN